MNIENIITGAILPVEIILWLTVLCFLISCIVLICVAIVSLVKRYNKNRIEIVKCNNNFIKKLKK